jgi:hypothetical protein
MSIMGWGGEPEQPPDQQKVTTKRVAILVEKE